LSDKRAYLPNAQKIALGALLRPWLSELQFAPQIGEHLAHL
jgi:hypothetical protein